MVIPSRGLRAAARLVLLGLAIASLGFSCDKTVNDESVNLLVTVRASLGRTNQQGAGDATLDTRSVALSADGRYLAFASKAANLVTGQPGLTAGDANGVSDIFLRDLVSRTTVLVSINKAGTGSGGGASTSPSISADGRYVAFRSLAPNIDRTDIDTDAQADIYVWDRTTGIPVLASRSSGALGDKANGACDNPDISADGRYVVFESTALNLDGLAVGGDDDDAVVDIYRRDLDPTSFQLTELVSRRSTVLAVPGLKGNGDSNRSRISGDGRYVVFDSGASNLVTNAGDGGPDSNSTRDCFMRDMVAEVTRRVSLTSAAGDPNNQSDAPSISGDGRYVVYRSNASNIHPDDDGPENDIFLYDTQSGVIIICSQHTFGTQAGNSCNFPVITNDGQFIVFQSGSSAMVNGDNNNRTDIYRHNRLTRETERLSVTTYGLELNGDSQRPSVSSNGLYVAFITDATNAADDDTNGAVDVYVRGLPR
jgi:Tol biopolymer transport system component